MNNQGEYSPVEKSQFYTELQSYYTADGFL